MVVLSIKISENIEFIKVRIKNVFEPIIESLNNLDFIKDQNIEVRVTDNHLIEIEKIANEWNLDPLITIEKEYSAYAKALTNIHFNEKQHIIIMHFGFIKYASASTTLYKLIISLNRKYYLPNKLLEKKEFYISKYYEAYQFILLSAQEKIYLWEKVKSFVNIWNEKSSPLIYLEEFQRKIKKYHYIYQSNRNLNEFNEKIIHSLTEFISFMIHAYYTQANTDDLMKYKKPIEKIINSIFIYKNFIDNSVEYNLNEFIISIDEFLELCFIRLKVDPNGGENIYIEFLKNPKILFKNEIIDTEERFVAFVDILGFSNMIKEYDKNPLSNDLKIIKNALEDSINKAAVSINKLYESQKHHSWGFGNFSDNIEFLEYRMFSDCFCFSIPYFNNKEDFISQFASLVIVLRMFQNSMFQNQIVVRGGLSTGSYYSDKNTIFSGGLVEAHELEKKAVMPRIIVNPDIMKRIKDYNVLFFDLFGLTESLLLDKKQDDYAFINPFGLENDIRVDVSKISNNIEGLYNDLNAKSLKYKALIKLIKFTKKISSSNKRKLKLSSPFDKNQIYSISKYDEISDFIKNSIDIYSEKLIKMENEKDSEDYKEISKIKAKYEWIDSLVRFSTLKDNTHEKRFIFPLAH
jgi:hypothetical protein